MDGRVICSSPAALGGGQGVLTPYFFTDSQAAISRGQGETISTKFITMPEFARPSAWTRTSSTISRSACLPIRRTLALTIFLETSRPTGALHLVDVHIAMNDLVALAAPEYEAFAAQPSAQSWSHSVNLEQALRCLHGEV